MSADDIPPIMRNQPNSGPYDPLIPVAPPPPPSPNGHHPKASIPLAHHMSETVYQPVIDWRRRASYEYQRKQYYKARLIFWQFIAGALVVAFIVLCAALIFHAEIVFAAPGGHP